MTTVSQETINGLAVFRPEGSIDITNSAELRDSLLETFKAGHQSVVLDLDQVNYVDSSGLSALVAAASGYEKQGAKVILCCIQPAVMKVLEMTKLTQFFEICSDLNEAEAKAQSLA